MPFSRLRSTKPLSSFVSSMPTLKSPSVHSRMRLTPPCGTSFRQAHRRARYLRRRPWNRPPGGCPGPRGSSAFRRTGVGGRAPACGARIHHDRHGIRGLKALEQQLHRLHHQGQLVGLIHGAAHVEQEDQIGIGPLTRWQLVAFDADMHELAPFPHGESLTTIVGWKGCSRDSGAGHA